MKHFYKISNHGEDCHSIPGRHSCDYYDQVDLFRLVSEAPDEDTCVLEDQFSARDILLTLAHFKKIKVDNYIGACGLNFQRLLRAVEEKMRRSGAFE